MIKRLITILILTTVHTMSWAIEYDESALGPLFTTPIERQSIDNAKRDDVPQESLRRVTPTKVKINGIVIRSNGSSTAWVNGKQTSGNNTTAGVKVLTRALSDKDKKIPVLVDGKSIKIKPGQSWSEESGTVVDNY